jgi:uncharacterized membrane protein YphA (DoxX/SURF4 family)
MNLFSLLSSAKSLLTVLGSTFLVLWQALPAQAHEAYVLTADDLNKAVNSNQPNVLTALSDLTNLRVSLAVVIGSAIAFGAYFFFHHSRYGQALDRWLLKFDSWGQVLLRIALAACLFASAGTAAYLGPELSIYSMPFSDTFQLLLVIVGIMILFGFLTEIAAIVGLVLFIIATVVYQAYMLTYVNYFGEFLALILFGSRFLSVDQKLFGEAKTTAKRRNWEMLLIRTTYGLSILYPAISIKLMQPNVICSQMSLSPFLTSTISTKLIGSSLPIHS